MARLALKPDSSFFRKGGRTARRVANRLMAGVVNAVLQSELTPVGSAMRVGDFDALTKEQRVHLQGPYFCCLQDVLWGFALRTLDEDLEVELHVTGDRNKQHEGKARAMYGRCGGPAGRLPT